MNANRTNIRITAIIQASILVVGYAISILVIDAICGYMIISVPLPPIGSCCAFAIYMLSYMSIDYMMRVSNLIGGFSFFTITHLI